VPEPSAWDLIDSVRMLVYGHSGTGKTTFASTFPAPILWLLCSGGSKPGELRSINTPENRTRITPRVIHSSDQLPELVEEGKRFKSVVLDHASGLQDLMLKEILGLDEIPAQRPILGDNKRTWGEVALRGKKAFRDLLNLPGHVVVIAQERVFGGEEESSDVIRPTVGAALTPSLTGWLNPACDYVVQAFKRPVLVKTTTKIGNKEVETAARGKGVEYCLRTEPHDCFMTKFRVPRGTPLPDVIVDPDFTKLMKVINGGK
jgi:hypothetical protein